MHLLERAAQPLLVAAGSLPATLAVVCVDSALWLLGVHASAALATLRPLWESMLVENMAASAAGLPLPHLAPLPFYSWFVWQGGSGAALPLALLLLRARSAQLKAVGRVGFLPALCNVNEPLLFGVPVVLNATLAVPFLVAPLLSTLVAYGALRGLGGPALPRDALDAARPAGRLPLHRRRLACGGTAAVQPGPGTGGVLALRAPLRSPTPREGGGAGERGPTFLRPASP